MEKIFVKYHKKYLQLLSSSSETSIVNNISLSFDKIDDYNHGEFIGTPLAKEANSTESTVNTNIIPLFYTKCAILETLGLDINKRELKNILNTYCKVNSSAKNTTCTKKGVNLHEFCFIMKELQDQYQNEIILNEIKFIDDASKGWVTEQDFKRVLDSIAPIYSRKHGHLLFRIADVNQVNAITIPQYKQQLMINDHSK